MLEDNDVQKEKMRVMGEQHIENENIVVIKNMTKVHTYVYITYTFDAFSAR